MKKSSCWFVFLAVVLAPLAGTSAQENKFLPDYYAETGLTDRATINDSPVEIIDPFTGHLTLAHTDVVVPGPGGFDIAVVRAYSSVQDKNASNTLLVPYERSPVGLGWTMHFGRVLLSANGCSAANIGDTPLYNPVYESPDGNRKMFFRESTGVFVSKDRWKAKCSPASGWTVWAPNGTKLEFGYSGSANFPRAEYATKITDRNGNYLEVSYGSLEGLVYVTGVDASDDRTVTFSYQGTTPSDFRLTRISSEGRNWDYFSEPAPGITNARYLTRVDRPDGRKWEYAYHPTSVSAGRRCISRVTYPYGAAIEYYYDLVEFAPVPANYETTVVKQKKVVGSSGVWDFVYSPGTLEDTTTIDSPFGRTIYKHYGAGSESSGTAWRIGLVKSIQVREGTSAVLQTTTFGWGSSQISDQSYLRPPRTNVVDNSILAPRMESREIVRDGATYETTFLDFDAYDNPQTIIEDGPRGESRTTRQAYFTDAGKWIVRGFLDDTTIDEIAGAIGRDFDDDGNLEEVNVYGRRHELDHYPSGDLESITDPEGNRTAFRNYVRGTAEIVDRPIGNDIVRSVNPDGTVESVTNGENDKTTYGYDGLGRVKLIDPPAGLSTNIVYSPSSPTISLTRGALTELRELDGFGRVEAVTLGGIRTQATLDLLGRKRFESYPDESGGTTYNYDALDRLTRVTHDDGSFRRFDYLSGNRMKVTDERFAETTFTYQSFGKPSERAVTKIENAPLSQTTEIVRDELNLIEEVRQGGKTREYHYDPRRLPDHTVHPEIGRVDYKYDGAGNMTERTIGGRNTVYKYDELNRLELIDYPPGTNDVSYIYDENSNLEEVDNGIARWVYKYTKNNVLDEERLVVWQAPQREFLIDYTINSLDLVSETTYPTGRVVSYKPDALGRPSEVGDFADDLEWHPTGQLENMTLGNDRRIEMGFDERMRVDSMRTLGGLAANEIDFGYGYDDTNNLDSLQDKRPSGTEIGMVYDALGRLKNITGGAWPGGGGLVTYRNSGGTTDDIETYRLGNSTQTYVYHPNNGRLDAVFGGSRDYDFEYDDYGNVTDDGLFTYTWNDAQNLTSILEANVSFTHDGNHRRVTTTADGGLKFIVYDRTGRLIGEYGESADQYQEYIYLGSRVIAQVKKEVAP